MTFTGTVERADALKGTVELGGNGSATFTATRAKEQARGQGSGVRVATPHAPESDSR